MIKNKNISVNLQDNYNTEISLTPNDQVNQAKKLTAAEQFRKNIYDSIKQEIKYNLRKQYEKRQIK